MQILGTKTATTTIQSMNLIILRPRLSISSIYVITPYLTSPDAVRSIIRWARKHGVPKVKVLLKSDAKCFQFSPRSPGSIAPDLVLFLINEGIDVKFRDDLHAKMYFVEYEDKSNFACHGSVNLTINADNNIEYAEKSENIPANLCNSIKNLHTDPESLGSRHFLALNHSHKLIQGFVDYCDDKKKRDRAYYERYSLDTRSDALRRGKYAI